MFGSNVFGRILRKTITNLAPPTALVSSSLFAVEQQVRLFSVKSHAGIKKRFRANANGLLKYRASGRSHGMRKHSRNRNRDKGATQWLRPGSSANLYGRYARNIVGLKPASGHVKPRLQYKGDIKHEGLTEEISKLGGYERAFMFNLLNQKRKFVRHESKSA